MIPQPVVNGLHLCHNVNFDLDRHEITLTKIFRHLQTPLYPSLTNPFWAFAAIYGPIGRGNLQVTITTLDQQEMVYDFHHSIGFSDRLSPVYLKLNMGYCRFPRVGEYEMMLKVDHDIVAQRMFSVLEEGTK